jgi:hypothetical protein
MGGTKSDARWLVIAGVALGLTASACSASPHRDVVASAAAAFASSLERGDGTAACRMLTTDARQAASGATDVPCAKAVTSVVEHGRAVHGVQVWGDAAQVRLGDDVLFLRCIAGKWRISAAGCKPRRVGPYDCTVGS